MSEAREFLDQIAGFAECRATERAALVDEIYSDIRAEVRREAAVEIREMVGPREPYPNEDVPTARYVAGWHGAADLIDPDKGES